MENLTKNYDQITWLCAHNSFANRHEGYVYSQQKLTLEEQFKRGIRSFMIDIHTKNDKLYLAHGSITTTRFIRPFRKLESFEHLLKRIARLIQMNRNEIITLHLESYSNNRSAKTIPTILGSSGAYQYLYTDDQWTTVKEMIQRNKRLVIFSNRSRDKPFFYTGKTMETNYDLSKSNKNNLRRDNRSPRADIFIMNHFYSFTWFKRYSSVNSRDNLGKRVKDIERKYGKKPNFIALDHVDKGDGIEIVNELNE